MHQHQHKTKTWKWRTWNIWPTRSVRLVKDCIIHNFNVLYSKFYSFDNCLGEIRWNLWCTFSVFVLKYWIFSYKYSFIALKITKHFILIGFFAWAAATTVALIIIILKRLLCQNCKCLRRCMHDYDPQPDQQRPTQQPVQSDNIPLNMLHTPPSTSASNFSTPPLTDASNFSTPPSTDASDFSTPTSVKPLIPEKTSPVGTRTRSKCVKKI